MSAPKHTRFGMIGTTMLDDLQLRRHSKSFVKTIYVWFLRIMAGLCILNGLVYWAQLIGLTGDGAFRFDLLQPHWRLLSTVLAVLLPSAALGLWMTQTWGVLLWTIAMFIEVLAFGYWADMFLSKPLLVLGHLVAFGFLLFLAAILFTERRRKRLIGI